MKTEKKALRDLINFAMFEIDSTIISITWNPRVKNYDFDEVKRQTKNSLEYPAALRAEKAYKAIQTLRKRKAGVVL